MFEDSLMDSVAHTHPRGRSMLVGFGLQLVALSTLVLYPLMHPQTLTSLLREPPVIVLSASLPEELPHRNAAHAAGPAIPVIETNAFTAPRTVPCETYRGPDVSPPQVFASDNTCHAGCAPIGVTTGSPALPVLATLKPPRVVISHLEAGQILSRVQPVYPVIAKATRIQGTVILRAIIGRDGNIENLRVISSASRLLNPAALEAVSQWKFRPYILNGSAIEVETEIMVNFKLSQ